MAKAPKNDAPEADAQNAQVEGNVPPAAQQPQQDTSDLPDSEVTNTPNPALPDDTDVGTLEQPYNTGSGDTPNTQTPGSAPGPEGAERTIATGPYKQGQDNPTQEQLPPTKTEGKA